MSKKKFDILIVDDEEVIIESIRKIAKFDDYTVDSTLETNEAFDKLNKNDYKIIICDIMMPVVDGFQFLNEVHNKMNLNIPVIMTTGYSTVDNAIKSLITGAIDFIPKPFDIDEMRGIIKRGIEVANIFDKIIEDDLSVHFVPCPSRYYRLGYTSWMNIEHNGSVTVGVTDLFVKTIENIKYFDFFELEENIIQGSLCASILTGDEFRHNILSPVSGRIIDRNDKLNEESTLILKTHTSMDGSIRFYHRRSITKLINLFHVVQIDFK